MSADKEIVNSRVLNYPREFVWRAYSEPEHLAAWWGPKGFRNTFHYFDFREGGDWKFMMHGPDGKDYENHSQFLEIKKPERIVLKHINAPHFTATIRFEDLNGKTKLSFCMNFETAELYASLKDFCKEKNEENTDRLEAELKRMTPNK